MAVAISAVMLALVPMAGARAEVKETPASAVYPEELESERILCEQYVPNSLYAVPDEPNASWQAECVQVAREFYNEIKFQVAALTDPALALKAFEVNRPGTTFLLPDGTYTKGREDLLAVAPSLLGGTEEILALENKFLYKPIDRNTVIFLGDPKFTFDRSLEPVVHSVQTSVYRRLNYLPNALCRSRLHPNLSLCWAELTEQWVYAKPLLGILTP
ncbi:hypothetical protein [Actinocorallia lasiicapitis]